MWEDVVVTFSTGEYGTTHDNIAKELQDWLEPMDIKLLPFLHPSTTHYLNAKMKNSTKSLQALVRLIPIVTKDFAKALHSSMDGLERDFKLYFPDPIEYLPNDDIRLAVNGKRRDCFQGLSFIFFDPEQRDRLISVITTGSGKCLLYDASQDDYMENSKRAAQNIVDFVNKKGHKSIMVRPASQKNPRTIDNDRFERLVNAATVLGMDLLKETDIPTSILECDFDLITSKTARRAQRTPSAGRTASRRTSSVGDVVSRHSSAKNGSTDQKEDVTPPIDNDPFDFVPIPSKRKKKEANEKSKKKQKTLEDFKTPSIPDLEEEILQRQDQRMSETPGPSEQEPEPELNPEPEPELEPERQPQSEGENENIEEHIPRLRDLALIECSMPVHKYTPHLNNSVELYAGRPNFKKFRRKGTNGSATAIHSKRVPLVEADIVSEKKAKEVQRMFSEFNHKRSKHYSSERQSKRPKTETENLAPSDDEDEKNDAEPDASQGLFVAPPEPEYMTIDEDDDTNKYRKNSKGHTSFSEEFIASDSDKNNYDDDDDDDGYSFRFSRD